MSTMKKKSTMLSMLAIAMMNDPLVHDLFCGPDREPKQEKDPNSSESKAKLEKAEAKRQRKAAKMKRDAEKQRTK
jgi:hypothetical protein